MESRKHTHRFRHKRSYAPLTISLFLLFIASAITVWVGYTKFVPSNEQYIPSQELDYPIYVNHQPTSYSAIVNDQSIKLPLPLLENVLHNSPIYYEEESNIVVLTTSTKVLRFQTESLNALLNEREHQLAIAADLVEGVVYLPVQLLNELYGLQVEFIQESNIVLLYYGDFEARTAIISREKGSFIRTESSIKSPYIEQLKSQEQLYIIESIDEDWYYVQTESGNQGYIKASHITLGESKKWDMLQSENKPQPASLNGTKINLTWEAIYNRQPNLASMPSMEGVNVVSPTWFELIDSEGMIQSKATHEYTKWAHERGYQVWALFSNGFNPDWTTEVLSSVEKRFKMIEQIAVLSEIYHVDGINIDFENVYTQDKENLVQFVKELTPILHEMNLIVSIDVTPKSNSEMWSVFLDREALAKVVDYMMVMTYDEHWAASPIAGSVASLPWVERSITRILEEDQVPSSKHILGIPLYTRVWSETPQEDGTFKVSSKAIGMEAAQSIINEHKLTPQYLEDIGQHYVEYTEEGILKKIWLEDDQSIKNRIELVHKYNLAGIATWQRAFQTESIWKVMNDQLNK